jgi:type I restriction enzyme R subunit
MSKHHSTKEQRRALAERMKDPKDPLQLVIVRDMWLTGFDAPSMHTLYIDKPMKGHNLMQAIARVNRVFKDKPGGLVVDYLGIAADLKKALSFYSDAGGKGDPTIAGAGRGTDAGESWKWWLTCTAASPTRTTSKRTRRRSSP